MKLRKFTPAGVERFNEYLDLLQTEPARLLPVALLEDSAYSEVFGNPTDIERSTFVNRYAAAEWLESLLGRAGVAESERDVGLWAWLTLFFFDQLCPPNNSGERQLRERPAYIPEPNNFQRYYRHLLLGPYLIYHAHRDAPQRAMAFLCRTLPIIDEVVAQLASRQELITNRALVELATKLYYDPASGTTKRGSSGKGGGSPRRLADVLQQFDVTWDLYAMKIVEFLTILPSEFDKFRPSTP